MELPDFLQLSDEDVAREKRRQDTLRRDFHSRVRLSSAQNEAARAMVLEDSLRTALNNVNAEIASLIAQGRNVEAEELTTSGGIKDSTANRLADNLAQQGRFIEASTVAATWEARDFYKKAGEAIFSEDEECDCGSKVEAIGQTRIALPKYRILKEVYSIKQGDFGFLVECSTCGKWQFLTSNPLPAEITNHVDQPNDLERLKV